MKGHSNSHSRRMVLYSVLSAHHKSVIQDMAFDLQVSIIAISRLPSPLPE